MRFVQQKFRNIFLAFSTAKTHFGKVSELATPHATSSRLHHCSTSERNYITTCNIKQVVMQYKTGRNIPCL